MSTKTDQLFAAFAVPDPTASICPACLEDDTCGSGVPDAGILTVHCRHHRTGGLFFVARRTWQFHSPIDRGEWDRVLVETVAHLRASLAATRGESVWN